MNLTTPLVSVIIVNYNGRNFLDSCLASLMKVSYPNFEIILVDNNSSDDSIEFVKNNYSSVMIIKLAKNFGFAHPNNVGAKNAKGEYFLFLNNDTKVTPDFISEMVQILTKDKTVGICQSMLLTSTGEVDSSGDFIDSLGVAFRSKEKTDHVREILSARGASMLIRKNLFEKLGGFDEKFFVSFEDVDLGWRAWIAGQRVLMVPSSVVYHFGGQTTKRIRSELTFHGYKNQLSMKFTNFEPRFAIRSLVLFFLVYGFRELHVLLDYIFKGRTNLKATKYENIIAQNPSIKDVFKSIFWILTNQKYLLDKYKRVRSTRALGTKDLIQKKVILHS